jgi:hypothetical protein
VLKIVFIDRMEYTFLFFCFLSVILISGGSFFLYSSGLQVAAPIFFLGSFGAVFYFGFRWFTPSGEYKANDPNNAENKWPPTINYCPDFLSLATTTGGTKVCIDTVGVATALPGATNQISKWTDTTQTGTAGYTFGLTDKGCDTIKSRGLTWEGVWGDTCSDKTPPSP